VHMIVLCTDWASGHLLSLSYFRKFLRSIISRSRHTFFPNHGWDTALHSTLSRSLWLLPFFLGLVVSVSSTFRPDSVEVGSQPLASQLPSRPPTNKSNSQVPMPTIHLLASQNAPTTCFSNARRVFDTACHLSSDVRKCYSHTLSHQPLRLAASSC
jgi:hypothetical protein